MASIVSVDTIQGLTSGQVTLPTGHKIKGTDVGSIVAPGGVIQTKYAKTTTIASTTSMTFTDIGLSVAITPKYATSLILVRARVPLFAMNNTVANWGGGIRIVRDSTVIDDSAGDYNGPLDQWINLPVTAGAYKDFFFQQSKETIDIPSTTSQITYKVQFAARPTSTTLKTNWDGSNYFPHSVLIVQEIAQ